MDTTQEPYEVAGELSQKQLRIMESIRTRGGKTKTSRITDDTDLDSSLVNYHFKRLMSAGLLERLDRESSDPMPREGFTYQITDRGEKVLSEAQQSYGMDPLGERVVRQRFEDLEGRVEKLEQEKKHLASENEELEERVSELEERFENMRELNANLYETVQEIK
ncbi:hypothetical protein CV102_23865 [Natronococcus pandeyae]|uniref:HTH marR-type domain-containing protein n=1 Tax=Natronococcus pandeyae TaxID=2055836 RepID=A0A8J8PYK6_9EURY|nr:winged helix DNA-binding protein [Natronococcus pandeyae]TYL36181.1 hypothetical protein CV102_23865 [Natronococcus pandeyae]